VLVKNRRLVCTTAGDTDEVVAAEAVKVNGCPMGEDIDAVTEAANGQRAPCRNGAERAELAVVVGFTVARERKKHSAEAAAVAWPFSKELASSAEDAADAEPIKGAMPPL
jgi:hypothetical protein